MFNIFKRKESTISHPSIYRKVTNILESSYFENLITDYQYEDLRARKIGDECIIYTNLNPSYIKKEFPFSKIRVRTYWNEFVISYSAYQKYMNHNKWTLKSNLQDIKKLYSQPYFYDRKVIFEELYGCAFSKIESMFESCPSISSDMLNTSIILSEEALNYMRKEIKQKDVSYVVDIRQEIENIRNIRERLSYN